MPDIFRSLCSCVGTCAARNFDPTRVADPNLILHFHTASGLWGCQDACDQTKNCEFYTHSKLTYFEEQDKYAEIPGLPVFHCFLWKKCDNFFIPEQNESWLDLRSGPRDCTLYTQFCLIVKSKGETLMPLPPGYTKIPCSETTSDDDNICGFEVRKPLTFRYFFLFPHAIWMQGLNSSPWTPKNMKTSGQRKRGKRKNHKGVKKRDILSSDPQQPLYLQRSLTGSR